MARGLPATRSHRGDSGRSTSAAAPPPGRVVLNQNPQIQGALERPAIHIAVLALMITVQMTLEPDLVKIVGRLAKRRGLSRSAFTREALAKAVEAEAIRAQEEQHRQGDLKKPVRRGEFSVPAGQQRSTPGLRLVARATGVFV